MLFITPTPIGNMKDITLRALEALKEADLIAAEDTRRTAALLKHYNIENRLISYNEHNERRRIPELISMLTQGKKICLVSDSGTPLVSDPGFKLVREAISAKIHVTALPGPCAAVAALTCSGLPTDRFSFYGFLPKKEKAKRDLFSAIRLKEETAIAYESPYRIKATVELIAAVMPDSDICIARELTKHFEEIIRGKPANVLKDMGQRNLKGEICVLIGKESGKKSNKSKNTNYGNWQVE